VVLAIVGRDYQANAGTICIVSADNRKAFDNAVASYRFDIVLRGQRKTHFENC
jgi:protocatechuate 3,4-dioxygenase beta subunit